MITHLNGIQNAKVKIFSRDGGSSPVAFSNFETDINDWLTLNPTYRIYGIDIQLIERVFPNPDRYLKWVTIIYKN